MSRKTLTVAIEAPGRDHGKVFKITEMGAVAAERWAMRAFLALARSGVQVPDDVVSAGLAGIATLGLRALAGVHFADAEPLMDELMQCVAFVPEASKPAVTVRWPLCAEQIEEVGTLVKLKMEAFKLHVDFSSAAGLLK